METVGKWGGKGRMHTRKAASFHRDLCIKTCDYTIIMNNNA